MCTESHCALMSQALYVLTHACIATTCRFSCTGDRLAEHVKSVQKPDLVAIVSGLRMHSSHLPIHLKRFSQTRAVCCSGHALYQSRELSLHSQHIQCLPHQGTVRRQTRFTDGQHTYNSTTWNPQVRHTNTFTSFFGSHIICSSTLHRTCVPKTTYVP